MRLLIMVMILLNTLCNAQNTIEGLVLNSNNEPLIGVNIYPPQQLTGEEIGTVSNIDGTFNIITTLDSLTFSYLGFINQTIYIKDKNKITIWLKQDSNFGDHPIIISERAILTEPINITTLTLNQKSIALPGNTNDVLNLLPGLHMQSGGYNTNKLSIRGIGSRSQFATSSVKTFYNGIPLHSAVGESAIEDIGLHMSDRVEIIKGTTGAKYESGYGGAIILKNKNVKAIKTTQLSTESSMSAWGHIRTQNKISLGRTNLRSSHNLDIYQSYVTDNGYRDNNNFKRNNITLNYTFNKSGRLKLSALVNHVDLDAFIPSSLNLEDYDSNPTKAAFTWNQSRGNEDYTKTLVGLNLDYDFNYLWSMSHTAYGRIFQSSELRPFNTIDEDYTSIGIKGIVRHISAPGEYGSDDYEINLGYRVQKEDYNFGLFDTDIDTKGALFSDGGDDRWTTELYATIIANINEKWRIQGDYNLQYALFSINETNTLNKLYFLPELNVSYQINPYNRLFGRFGQGVNYFSPDDARLPNGEINSNLRPSKASNWAIGAKGYLNKNRFKYRFEIYTMEVENLLIVERDDTNQAINKNGGKANYQGTELELSYKLIDGRKESLEANANLGLMNNKYVDFIDDADDFSGNKIPGSPQSTVQAMLQYRYWGLFANARYNQVSSYYMRDDNTIKSDAYQLVHATLGYKLVRGKWTITPRMDIQNITNEKYASMTLVNASSFGGNAPRYYYPGLPRHIMLTLGVSYDI